MTDEVSWQQFLQLKEQSATPGHRNQRQAREDYRHVLMAGANVITEREEELRR